MGWFTNTVEVEKVVEKVVEKTILGTPEPVVLYRAYRDEIYAGYGMGHRYQVTLGYYQSCAQAFSENPDAKVEEVKRWKVGDKYIAGLEVFEIEVQPKPKRSKGKAKA